jgi:hypothetical protein
VTVVSFDDTPHFEGEDELWRGLGLVMHAGWKMLNVFNFHDGDRMGYGDFKKLRQTNVPKDAILILVQSISNSKYMQTASQMQFHKREIDISALYPVPQVRLIVAQCFQNIHSYKKAHSQPMLPLPGYRS